MGTWATTPSPGSVGYQHAARSCHESGREVQELIRARRRCGRPCARCGWLDSFRDPIPPPMVQPAVSAPRRSACALAFGDLETPTPSSTTAFSRQVGDARAARSTLTRRRIARAGAAPFGAALALDPPELGLEGEQQRYRGRVGRLMLGRGFRKLTDRSTTPVRAGCGPARHPFGGGAKRQPRRQRGAPSASR